jgi:hypothetical protein
MQAQSSWGIELANLRLIRSDATTLHCPVCRESVAEESLTRGDVFPEICRSSKLVVPECKTCNNELGSRVDSVLATTVAMIQHAHGVLPAEKVGSLFGNRVSLESDSVHLHPLAAETKDERVKLDFGYSVTMLA